MSQHSTLMRLWSKLPIAALAALSATQAAGNGNDGGNLSQDNYTGPNMRENERGLYALEDADLVNLIVVPPYTDSGDVSPLVVAETISNAKDGQAMMIIDPPSTWTNMASAADGASVGRIPIRT